MKSRIILNSRVLLSTMGAVLLLVASGISYGQTAEDVLEEITVTGSYIKGSNTTGALPITVVGRSDIEALGAPTTVDIVNNLTINTGSENRSNALGGQNRNTGTANINLRGLGLDKTLILFNGKRQTIHSTSAGSGASFVDINIMPSIALDRMEVLKDGAAATYGSDAVVGVVNFITRTEFEGFEVAGSYRDRTDTASQANWDVSGIWGWAGERSNLVIAGAYSQVERLTADKVDWTTEQLEANRGVSTLAAPGAFIPLANPTTGVFAGAPLAGLPLIANTAGSPVADCGNDGIMFNALGGTSPLPGAPPFVGRCGYSFVKHFNLADDQEKINLWSTFETDLSGDHQFYAEAAYYGVDVSDIGNSPSFPVLRFVVMPATHPANPHGVPGIYLGRPYGQNQPTQTSWRDYETLRAVGGFRGTIGDSWNYDTSISYSSNNVEESSPTVLQQRFADAINGLGGPNCDTVNGTAGVGDCLWFNPFSTRFTDPALANDPSIEPFMRSSNDLDQTADLLVLDAVLTRDLWDMGAGTVQGAFGFQFRDESLEVKRNPEAIIPDNFIFVGGGQEVDETQDVYAVFGELAIPLGESVEAQVALRYEDYGGQIGDTLDPKVALLWSATDTLAFRASASTTFRAPTLHQRFNRETNLIPFVDLAIDGVTASTGFKGAETTGNTDLKPETATTFNIGLVLSDLGNFNMTLDYWNIDFEDVIAVENAQTKVTIENTLCTARTPDCRDPDIIRNPLPGEDPSDNLQHSGEISKVIARFINAPTVKTSGVDLNANLGFDTNSLGGFVVGLDYSHVIEYELGGIQGVENGAVTTVTIDAVGSRNDSNIATSLPQNRANAYIDWFGERHSAKFVVRYIDEYEDDKTADQRFNAVIDSWTTLDLYYNFNFSNDRTTLGLNVTNIADEDPPFADQDLNFDARVHSPFGRQYQLVFRHNFGS
jgi:iron complex outermembrane receptor protein